MHCFSAAQPSIEYHLLLYHYSCLRNHPKTPLAIHLKMWEKSHDSFMDVHKSTSTLNSHNNQMSIMLT
jgi:hypothetical protein